MLRLDDRPGAARALLGSPTARVNLAKQAAAAVRARGADGINLDFEPIASGYGDEYAPSSGPSGPSSTSSRRATS